VVVGFRREMPCPANGDYSGFLNVARRISMTGSLASSPVSGRNLSNRRHSIPCCRSRRANWAGRTTSAWQFHWPAAGDRTIEATVRFEEQTVGARESNRADVSVNNDQAEALVAQHNQARAKRDFARSDALQDQPVGLGVTIEDRPDGSSSWRWG
jgi:hypothetical protein